jgi:hypothetical protein
LSIREPSHGRRSDFYVGSSAAGMSADAHRFGDFKGFKIQEDYQI